MEIFFNPKYNFVIDTPMIFTFLEQEISIADHPEKEVVKKMF